MTPFRNWQRAVPVWASWAANSVDWDEEAEG